MPGNNNCYKETREQKHTTSFLAAAVRLEVGCVATVAVSRVFLQLGGGWSALRHDRLLSFPPLFVLLQRLQADARRSFLTPFVA